MNFLHLRETSTEFSNLHVNCQRLIMDWADGPGSIPGGGGVGNFSSLIRVQTGPGVHSVSCKMNPGAFPGGKDGRA